MMSSTGFTGSVTMACSAMVVMGRLNPANLASSEEYPATFITTLSAAIVPWEVCTPRTRPRAISKPLTSQFCTMSTPRALAARA